MRNTNSLTVAEAIEPGDRLRACYVALLLFFLIPVSLMGQNEKSQDVFEKMFHMRFLFVTCRSFAALLSINSVCSPVVEGQTQKQRT